MSTFETVIDSRMAIKQAVKVDNGPDHQSGELEYKRFVGSTPEISILLAP